MSRRVEDKVRARPEDVAGNESEDCVAARAEDEEARRVSVGDVDGELEEEDEDEDDDLEDEDEDDREEEDDGDDRSCESEETAGSAATLVSWVSNAVLAERRDALDGSRCDLFLCPGRVRRFAKYDLASESRSSMVSAACHDGVEPSDHSIRYSRTPLTSRCFSSRLT